MAMFDKLKQGLKKTRQSIANGLDIAFGDYSEVNDEFFEELEDILVMSDMGIDAAKKIISETKTRIYSEHLKKPDDVKNALIRSISEKLISDSPGDSSESFPQVMLVVGVNGVGKTTSVGKLAINFEKEGKKTVLASADTYRAAASEQLDIWAKRSNADIVKHEAGGDPAAVIYEAVDVFRSKNADVLICDTAGRLHNKKNLMNELSKINSILERKLPEIKKEVLLVLDATTGQNAISQVREFISVCEPTGIILTKMDGSAKGGIIIAISSEFKIPVKYIGVGEGPEDLEKYVPCDFVRAIFY